MAFDPETERRSLALGAQAHRQLVCEYAGLMEQARAQDVLKPDQNRRSDDQIKHQVLAQMAHDHARVLEEEHCRAVWELFLESVE